MTASCIKSVESGFSGCGLYVSFSSKDNWLHMVKFLVVIVIVRRTGSTSLVSVAKHDGPQTSRLAQFGKLHSDRMSLLDLSIPLETFLSKTSIPTTAVVIGLGYFFKLALTTVSQL